MHTVRNAHSTTHRETAVPVRAKEKVKAKEKGADRGLRVEVETDHRRRPAERRYAHTICKANAQKVINAPSSIISLVCSITKAFAERGNIACSPTSEK